MNTFQVISIILATSCYLTVFGRNEKKKELISTIKVYVIINKDPIFCKTVSSSISCVQICVNYEGCGAAMLKPFDADQTSSGTCLLYDTLTEKDITNTKERKMTIKGWAYIIKRPISCKEAFRMEPRRTSGIVHLDIGKHYCKIDPKFCSKGSWTLAVKVNGEKETFKYDSQYWTNASTYNEEKCLENISSNEEGKFRAFISLPFEKICLEMRQGKDIRGLELPVEGKSLQKIFKSGKYIKTHLGRNAWKSLVYGSSLQINCKEEGLNIQDDLPVRIGIKGNDQFMCKESDSFIGVGAPFQKKLCFTHLIGLSSGNFARCGSDNGDKQIKTVSMIYIY